MKSIKEKAKAYDNIIKKANKMHHENCEACKMCIEELIPELAESEDVVIKEKIIATIHLYYGEPLEDEAKEMIAWIEKQGEQKPAEWRQDNVEELTEFENVMMHIGDSFFGQHAGLDPNDTNAIKEQANLLLEFVANKPAWSEEDEENSKNILYILNQLKGTAIYKEDKTAKNCLNWLKSLKDRYIWKPSDEQMKVLNEVLNFAANHESPHWNDYIFGTLNNLIRQLKKLKGE